ncbi:hypothetical protein BHE74_00047910 [Ensete ventricosum]|nr:hypothetical protein BHE74_00047910 [Ensete ventricosum]
MAQGSDEPLSQFVGRFTSQVQGIPTLHPSLAIQAFLTGLRPSRATTGDSARDVGTGTPVHGDRDANSRQVGRDKAPPGGTVPWTSRATTQEEGRQVGLVANQTPPWPWRPPPDPRLILEQLPRQLGVEKSPLELLRCRRVIPNFRRVLQLLPSGLHLLLGVLMPQVRH